MDFSDSSSIKFWESVAILGGLAVIVGLFGELAEFLPSWLISKRFREWFHKKDRLLLDQLVRRFRPYLVPIEGWFFVLLMAGLAVELFGSARAMLLSDAENRELRRQLWIISDGDVAGRRWAQEVLTHVARDRFCRWIQLPDGLQPTDYLADFYDGHMGK